MLNPRNPYRPTGRAFQTLPTYKPFCGYCGQDCGPGPGGKPGSRHHLQENGSGEIDEEQDADHLPKPEDYHDPEEHEEAE